VFGYQTFLVEGKGSPLAKPVFSPKAGTYGTTQTVSISDPLAAATIYYTTDGSTPTTSSTVYTGPITVSASETLKALADATGYLKSPVATAIYTITP
jgi:ribosome-binding factor A